MTGAEELFDRLTPMARLHMLPPTVSLNTEDAALFLGLKPRTLKRYRVEGGGPQYVQGGAPGAVGTGQLVRYPIAYLLEWQKQMTVGSAMEAAVRKGQMFANIADLAEEIPFYVDAKGHIAGPVGSCDMATVIDRLDDWTVEWMPATDAASRAWTSVAVHAAFDMEIDRAIKQIERARASGLEASELSEFLPEAPRVRGRRIDD